jgi:signal transduction histidine kinase
LERISKLASSSLEPAEIFEQILDELTSISGLGVQSCWIQFLDAENEELRLIACRGFTEKMVEIMNSMKLGKDPISRVVLNGEPLVSSDISIDSNYAFIDSIMPGARSLAIVPVVCGGSVLGIIGLCSNTPDKFAGYVKLLSITGTCVATAISRVLHLHRNNRTSSAQAISDLGEKQELLNALSHELQTPLTALIASAGLLAEEIEKEPRVLQLRLIQNILHSASNLQSHLVEMLDISSTKTNQFRIKIKAVDFPVLLRMVVDELIPVAEGKKQSMIMKIESSLAVEADEQRLEQILNNLLSNAIKFTPQGGRITVKAKKHNADLVVEIMDTGLGISKEEQQKLFRPYYRVPADSRRYNGIGLGLSITKQLVELHGGGIWVESEPGKGSTFAFSIPLVRHTTK